MQQLELSWDFSKPRLPVGPLKLSVTQPPVTLPPALNRLPPAERKLAQIILADTSRQRGHQRKRIIAAPPVQRRTFSDELREIVCDFIAGRVSSVNLASEIARRFETSIEYAHQTYALPIIRKYSNHNL